jgi:hypothetical protein
MSRLLRLLYGSFQRLVCSRRDLLLENLVLRQQLVTLQRGNGRPKLSQFDRTFWVAVRRLWSKWKQALVIVNPETVVRWHRTGFRLYWSWLSGQQKAFGRKQISKEVRDLISACPPKIPPGALHAFTVSC